MWNTPLLVACCHDNSDIVKVLLDHDASVRASDGHERTALFLAVENDQDDVVKVRITMSTPIQMALHLVNFNSIFNCTNTRPGHRFTKIKTSYRNSVVKFIEVYFQTQVSVAV